MKNKTTQLVLLAIGAFVIGVLAYIFSILHPDSVNGEFSFRLSVSSFVASFILLFLFRLRLKEQELESLRIKPLSLEFHHFFFSLIPMTPVLVLVVSNSDSISFFEGIQFVSLTWLASLFFSVLLPKLLDFTGKSTLLISGFTAVNYVVFSMGALSSSFGWSGVGNFPTQLAILAVVLILTFAVSQLGKKGFILATSAFLAISMIFSFPAHQPQIAVNENIASLIGPTYSNPSVVLLVYESYPAPETLSFYGHDPEPHIRSLQKLGFDIYDGVWSVGPSTMSAISRVLSSEAGYTGNARQIASGEGDWISQLASSGYRTSTVLSSDYLFRGEVNSWDYSYPNIKPLTPQLLAGLFAGEFDFTLSYTSPPYGDYLALKRGQLSELSAEGEFFYTHNKFPGHSQNSGECLPNETDLFLERLARADSEMVSDIDSLGDQLKDSIVFIFADHGPYLTENCTSIRDLSPEQIDRFDLQDRLGTFFAVRWPEGLSFTPEIEIIQDVIPAVLSVISENPDLYDQIRWPRDSSTDSFGEVSVVGGVVRGGIDDGKSLFENYGLIENK